MRAGPALAYRSTNADGGAGVSFDRPSLPLCTPAPPLRRACAPPRRSPQLSAAVERVEKAPGAPPHMAMASLNSVLLALATSYWAVMTFVIVPTVCALHYVFVMPLRPLSRRLFLRLERALCRLVNDQWAACGLASGTNIVEFGEDVSTLTERRCLVVCNHLGLFDHFILMVAMHNKGTVPERYLWLIYNIWQWTPLGLMWILHGNYFINGGAHQRERLLGDFGDHLKRNFWTYDYRWIVMYPEGSRLFLAQEGSQKFAKKHGYPDLKHCALPRVGAAKVVLDICGPKAKNGTTSDHSSDHKSIEYVIDVTLGYSKGRVPELGSAMMNEWPGNDSNVAIHYSVHKVTSDLVDNEDNLRDFFFKMWVEKEKKLEYFYEHGKFDKHDVGRPVEFAKSRALFVQLFWLFGLFFHVGLWLGPLTLFVGRQILSFLL
uniref:Phospholipid/glycerol acyltransferase domain-containing protein n=1 Tax=Plectus sambesii TaxID=2011161 RepID=A0A914VC32_9BILA